MTRQLFKHYKGDWYEVLAEGLDDVDGGPRVIMHKVGRPDLVRCVPSNIFYGHVKGGRRRYRPIERDEVPEPSYTILTDRSIYL